MSSRRQRISKNAKAQALTRLSGRIFIAVAILFVLYHLVLLAVHEVNQFLIKVTRVSEGSIEEKFEVQAVVLNRETVVSCPGSGRFVKVVSEGSRARKDSMVGRLYRDGSELSTPVIAPVSGLVSYHPDGLEQELAHYDLKKDAGRVFDQPPPAEQEKSAQFVTGQPMLKIVDNLMPTSVVVAIENEDGQKTVKPGDQMLLRYHDIDLGLASCSEVLSIDQKQFAILSLPNFAPELLNVRKTGLYCIKNQYNGIIVPEKALCRQDNQDGVYCLEAEMIKFNQVEVLHRQDGQAVVRGIEDGAYVVNTPAVVYDGMMYR